MSLPARWMAGGALLALFAFIGLVAIAPLHYQPPQPRFFLSLLLLLSFGIAWVTLTISFNCWLNLKLSRGEPIVSRPYAAQNNPILPWPGQEMTTSEQSV